MAIQSVVSNNSNSKEKYGFSEEEQINIVLKINNNKVVDIIIGSSGSVMQTVYAKRIGDNKVYAVSGSYVTFAKSDWVEVVEEEKSAEEVISE